VKARRKTKGKTHSKGWVRFARVFLCGVGAFFLAAPIYWFLIRDVPVSIGMILVGLFGLVLICLGVFTSDKAAVEIAESI